MAEDQHRGSPVVTIIHPACFHGSTTCLGRKENKCWPLSPVNQKYTHFHAYKSLNTEGKEYVAEMSVPSTPPELKSIPGSLPERLDPVGAAEFGLYVMGELCSAERGLLQPQPGLWVWKEL